MKQNPRGPIRRIRAVNKGEWGGETPDPRAIYDLTPEELDERLAIEHQHDDEARIDDGEPEAKEKREQAQRVEQYCQRERKREERRLRRAAKRDKDADTTEKHPR